MMCTDGTLSDKCFFLVSVYFKIDFKNYLTDVHFKIPVTKEAILIKIFNDKQIWQICQDLIEM